MLDTTTISWQLIPFVEMSASQLHALLTLRAAVFVVEQNCPYQDPDEKDLKAVHVLGWCGDKLVACARILPAGVSYQEVSIGRVATGGEVRGGGAGRELMRACMQGIEKLYGNVPVKISAQSYLQKFYESFGFMRTEKAEYLEDDIPHIEMIYRP